LWLFLAFGFGKKSKKHWILEAKNKNPILWASKTQKLKKALALLPKPKSQKKATTKGHIGPLREVSSSTISPMSINSALLPHIFLMLCCYGVQLFGNSLSGFVEIAAQSIEKGAGMQRRRNGS
jgi:hypothetical protein